MICGVRMGRQVHGAPLFRASFGGGSGFLPSMVLWVSKVFGHVGLYVGVRFRGSDHAGGGGGKGAIEKLGASSWITWAFSPHVLPVEVLACHIIPSFTRAGPIRCPRPAEML